MSDIPEDDKKLFQNAMLDVTPLDKRNRNSRADQPKKAILPTNLPNPKQNHPEVSYEHMRGSEPKNQFIRSGIQRKLMRRLQQGKIPFEHAIDLHRLTLKEAELAVKEFIYHSQMSGYKCIKIIHGRGHHSKANSITLRHMVRYLLTQMDSVLAYSVAPPRLGGEGAVLVLLKRGQNE